MPYKVFIKVPEELKGNLRIPDTIISYKPIRLLDENGLLRIPIEKLLSKPLPDYRNDDKRVMDKVQGDIRLYNKFGYLYLIINDHLNQLKKLQHKSEVFPEVFTELERLEKSEISVEEFIYSQLGIEPNSDRKEQAETIREIYITKIAELRNSKSNEAGQELIIYNALLQMFRAFYEYYEETTCLNYVSREVSTWVNMITVGSGSEGGEKPSKPLR